MRNGHAASWQKTAKNGSERVDYRYVLGRSFDISPLAPRHFEAVEGGMREENWSCNLD
jgi:hypothetical protein